jgi:Rod binding domain-containing protein
MMRRKNTSRRVHTLSSDSIFSDEIAATDMAWSREGSRDGISDIWVGARDLEGAFIRRLMTSLRDKINPGRGFKLHVSF